MLLLLMIYYIFSYQRFDATENTISKYVQQQCNTTLLILLRPLFTLLSLILYNIIETYGVAIKDITVYYNHHLKAREMQCHAIINDAPIFAITIRIIFLLLLLLLLGFRPSYKSFF